MTNDYGTGKTTQDLIDADRSNAFYDEVSTNGYSARSPTEAPATFSNDGELFASQAARGTIEEKVRKD